MEITKTISLQQLEQALRKLGPGGDFVSVTIDGVTINDLARIGGRYWFEYHCNESHQSSDARVWYHSHQMCVVLKLAASDDPAFTDFEERADNANQLLYRVQFDDGLEWSVFEDELMDSRDHFCRPDPPAPWCYLPNSFEHEG